VLGLRPSPGAEEQFFLFRMFGQDDIDKKIIGLFMVEDESDQDKKS
jgi:hypothetical protein